VVQVIHNRVEGRTRFKIEGLLGSEPLKKELEQRLGRDRDILRVSANSLTGNCLVCYNSNNNHHTISFLIEDILEAFQKKDASDQKPEPVISGDLQQLSSALQTDAEHVSPSAVSRKTIKEFLGSTDGDGSRPWHTLRKTEIVGLLRSDKTRGLTQTTAQRRLAENGPNALAQAESRSGWRIFVDQMNSLPVYLLGAAAGVSVLTGGILDALVIMGVVAANGVIGYYTENDAEKTIDSLKDLVHPRAEVIRDGRVHDIPAEEVVVGDMLVFKPGAYVAADSRIIHASRLSIDESMLTGESMPVFKKPARLKHKNTPLAERPNMAYMGTLVTGGQGLAVVVATAQTTEVGMLQLMMAETLTPKTPIERKLEQMGDQLVLLCGAICGVVFGIGFLRGYGYMQMLRMGITLAASAVPEGLPAAATINFALGITNMRSKGVLVRRLQAVETLGAVQTICLDKTGTITENRMAVTRLYSGLKRYDVQHNQIAAADSATHPLKITEIKQLVVLCALNNEIKINGQNSDGEYEIYGSATEEALVRLALKAGFDPLALQKEYRFLEIRHRAENRHFMSTLHARPTDGHKLFSIKGSPTEVLSMCDRQMINGQIKPLTAEARQEIEIENERMAGDALRVLGFACQNLSKGERIAKDTPLIWLGLVGMADPIRDGVKDLIRVFHRAGMNTVMITGDQSTTAFAVAQELELGRDQQLKILDSAELTSLDPEKLEALAQKVRVYSRVSPAHKLKIVQALQAAGETVAMTGDGINDGPALKAANIGIAMGQSGTDVAREVADIIVEEDNLEILIKALEEGRTTYNNIRKSVHFFLATNLSEIQVMFAAMALGLGIPLNVMQLLWINIISDIFPGLALSREAPEPGLMEQPPRPAERPLFDTADFKRMAVESSLMSAGALAAYGYGISRYGMGAAAGSLAFQSLTLGQLLHAYSCRTETRSVFDKDRPPSNTYLNVAVGGSIALQLLTMVVPGLRRFLGVVPLNIIDAAVIGASAVGPFVVNELRKLSRPKSVPDA
jgi:Ca2+-transporting ATPase